MECSGRVPAQPAIEAGRDAKDEEHAMSQMGQQRHIARTSATSALPPIAPELLCRSECRKGPAADIAPAFVGLVKRVGFKPSLVLIWLVTEGQSWSRPENS